jgi:uncharacterized Zn finger protein
MKSATRVCGLRDCQQCGCEDATVRKVIYPVSKRPTRFFVECDNCGLEGDNQDTPELAVEKWNGEDEDE